MVFGRALHLAHRTSRPALYALNARDVRKRHIARASAASPAPRVAVEGDTVSVHFSVIAEDGTVQESSREAGQPISLEVGVGEVIGNQLLQAIDGGVRGLGIGETRRVEITPLQEEWSQDLLFKVPKEHPEIQRLEGKFRSAGGLQEGMIVELQNGNQAQVLKVSADEVVLDANDAMAGRRIAFDIELVSIMEAAQ